MPTAMPAFAPAEIRLELAGPVVFPGLDVDPEPDCVVRLGISGEVAELEAWV